MLKRLILLMTLLALLTVMLPGAAAQDDAEGEAPTLRMAVLPVLNTLPLYVAQSEGFYEEAGVNVELIPFNSAREQQVALRAGEVDGANTDMAVLATLVNGGVDMRAIRHEPIQEAYFSVIAGADTGIESPADLAGVPIAVSENTIIEYLTTTMLLDAGLTEDQIVYEEVPEIPRRLQLLETGEVQAATLPEPLTTLGTELQGGRVVVADERIDFVPTVLAVSADFIEAQPEAVDAFLAAYERAVNAINSDGEAYRDVMNSNIRVPEPLQATYPVPSFPTANVPTEAETAQVVDWMVANDLLPEALPYDQLVNGDLLPLPNLVELASGGEAFSTLLDAVSSAGLAETLSGGEYTVFAPTNAAFENVDLSGLSEAELTNVLTYHVVEGEVFSSALVESGSGSFTTVNGAEITYAVSDGLVTLNNGEAAVTQADLDASNGVIHVIDSVLMPGE